VYVLCVQVILGSNHHVYNGLGILIAGMLSWCYICCLCIVLRCVFLVDFVWLGGWLTSLVGVLAVDASHMCWVFFCVLFFCECDLDASRCMV